VFPDHARRDYTLSGGNRVMAPVLPVPSSSPRARESDLSLIGRILSLKSLMVEDGRIELHRVSPRLTALEAASTPNGLRLPHQNADALRRHRFMKDLEAPTGIEPAWQPLRRMRLAIRTTGPRVYLNS
jgi:hypothetical protein